MRNVDFSSLQAVFSTVFGLVFITLLGVGLRLLLLQLMQQKRERENRQINERLRTLIAAYKTLGGSFTGNLLVDPTHLRELRLRESTAGESVETRPNSDRARRIRDAVEAALSDIVLLGTEEQVRLAAHAATELVAGRPVETAALVRSLRDFIREVLALSPVPTSVQIPPQGPTRPGAAKKGEGGEGGGKSGGGGGGGMGGMGMGGMSMGTGLHHDDEHGDALHHG